MARVTRSSAAAAGLPGLASATPTKRQTKAQTPNSSSKRIKRELSPTPNAGAKLEQLEDADPKLKAIPEFPTSNPKAAKPTTTLADRKLNSYYTHDGTKHSPFPSFPHPTVAECNLAHRILSSLHGPRRRPVRPPAAGPASRAGCGDAPSVLDALVRTILSQNTSDKNSSRAKRSMDATYGRHDDWPAVAAGGVDRLEAAIRCGGLSAVKSRAIMSVLETCMARHGSYSLDHLRDAGDEEAMRELLAFRGVGPKTASCVLLFCLGRESFAVDTHVWRLSGVLGWRPERATREETHLHLDARVPDGLKYALHVLLIAHGKRCPECKAGGRVRGDCELRKAFLVKAETEVGEG